MHSELTSDRLITQLTPTTWLRANGLTPREAEAALLAARGLPLGQVAAELRVSRGTVKTLLSRARFKLTCRTTHELTILLLRAGVVGPEEVSAGPGHH